MGILSNLNFMGKIVDGTKEIVCKSLDKIAADKISDIDKMKIEMEINQQMQSFMQTEVDNFRNFMLQYEGEASEIPKLILYLRSSVRPVITYFITGIYGFAFLHPERFNEEQMFILKPALLMVLGFWFGERLLKRSGLLEVLGNKKAEKKPDA